ncbi:MAG: hypothetical protein KME11_03520 [Timaviella obliquedivisa GSE-PSE-MK23-08B]|jgi:hypothetical protein|nr:hypothetical protein [Timaviella obliquedivisa GSE-PSE-MK23-08B]
MKDFAGNTLASAKKLGSLGAKTLNFKDSIGSGDRDDLYTFSVGSSSGLNVNFSGAIAAELFTLKNRKAIKKIGKIDFSNLKRKDIRKNLIRVARSGSSNVPQISIATLNPGDYYLRVRSSKNKINYSVAISSPTAIADPEPLPTFDPNPIPNPVPIPPVLVPIPNSLPTLGITTSLFSGTGLPKTQGWLDFNQIPISSLINQPPFLSNTAKTVVQTSGTTGVTFKTDEGIATTADLNKGYAGYSNYTATIATPFPLTFKSAKVNPAFPTLDRTAGYSLSFRLAVTSEVSNPDRAGFSITLISEDAKGIELGFKSDRIFAQSSTFTESETAIFSTNIFTNYKLAVKGDGYELFANNASILKGALRTYEFNPATSNPPLPASPYVLPSFLFLGDNTDQGRATVTLGAIDITQG